MVKLNNFKKTEFHAHTEWSNASGGFRDSTNTVASLVDHALKMGFNSLALTDHEILSGHYKAQLYMKQLREENPDNKWIQEFKLMLGNEIYIEDENGYYGHFILIAKNKKGHELLRRFSTNAWTNARQVGRQYRKGTSMELMYNLCKEYPDCLIASSACIGSNLGHYYQDCAKGAITKSARDKMADQFIEWAIATFGDNLFLEIQPALYEEQIGYNKWIVNLADKYDIKISITCDVHYLSPEERQIHHAYLNSEDDKPRETDAFYRYTYLMDYEERVKNLDYLPNKLLEKAFIDMYQATTEVEEYDLSHEPIIPEIIIPKDIPQSKHVDFYKENGYDGMVALALSDSKQENFFLHCIEEGYNWRYPNFDYESEEGKTILERVNIECNVYLGVSEKLDDEMVKYANLMKKIIDICWDEGDSLVGPSRGSAMCFETFYLLGVTNESPLFKDIDIPYWRLT